MTISTNALIIESLEELKGKDITRVDVRGKSDVTDTMIIACGTSSRHVKSLANNLVENAKKQGMAPLGVEGMEVGDWVLVDFGDTLVHVMQPETRAFYDLEKLWSVEPAGRSAD